MTLSSIDQYKTSTVCNLRKIRVPDMCVCDDSNCNQSNHKNAIDTLYDEISQSLRKSSLGTIPTCGTKHSRNYVIPGWNDYVKDQHQDARNSYVLWRNAGKPRQGPIADTMRRSRLNFKYALRQCQAMEGFMYSADADGRGRKRTDADGRGRTRTFYLYLKKNIYIFWHTYIYGPNWSETQSQTAWFTPPPPH